MLAEVAILRRAPGRLAGRLVWLLKGKYRQRQEDTVAMNVLRLRGEERGDYFFVVCAECGEQVSIKLRPGVGAPVLEASCQTCRTQTEQKLVPGKWSGFVTR
jgi:hypothetical protein